MLSPLPVGFMRSRAGAILPAYCTGLGKTLLAFRPEAEVAAWAATQKFTALTPRTITSARRLLRELRVIRERGYALDEEERETAAKLIAGLDRAAKEMDALVRYAQPLELRRQARADLKKIVLKAARDPAYKISGPLADNVPCEIQGSLTGAFDSHLLAHAFSALTREALAGVRASDRPGLTLCARRVGANGSPKAVVEWRGVKSRSSGADPSMHVTFAKRVINAHGGRIQFLRDMIRVTLPLLD